MAYTVNYRDTHFDRANLTPICGEPTYETVHKLWNEVKANARSVYSHLCGGTHGYLGLVLTAAQYADISTTVFTRPSHTGPLAIPSAATVVQRSTLQDAHIEDLQVFREVMGVEQALIQQIVATIDATYMEDVRDRTTNSINVSVSALLLHLQETYGTLMPHKFQKRKTRTRRLFTTRAIPSRAFFRSSTT